MYSADTSALQAPLAGGLAPFLIRQSSDADARYTFPPAMNTLSPLTDSARSAHAHGTLLASFSYVLHLH